MNPVKIISGIAAPFLRINVDTDAIIPSREIKAVSKKGLAEGLFSEWRYTSIADRTPNDEFILNREPFNRCAILLTGDNFGCGSSREHAVWALMDYGFDVVISTSFADIFYNNCFKNGLLPIALHQQQINKLIKVTGSNENLITIDLSNQIIQTKNFEIKFNIDARRKEVLIEGIDDISETLKLSDKIKDYENKKALKTPWMFNS